MGSTSKAISSEDELPAVYVEAFWKACGDTITEVFSESADLVDEYRARLADMSPSERLIVYHATPLQIAADLASIDIVTKEQAAAYLRVNNEFLETHWS